MPRFQIIPLDSPEKRVEIDCIDAGSALNVASQLRYSAADVRQDGVYLFSIRTLGGKSCFWQIFQRSEAPMTSDYISLG